MRLLIVTKTKRTKYNSIFTQSIQHDKRYFHLIQTSLYSSFIVSIENPICISAE